MSRVEKVEIGERSGNERRNQPREAQDRRQRPIGRTSGTPGKAESHEHTADQALQNQETLEA